MKSESFVYWLQGLFELGDPKSLNEEQTACIKRHLALVFVHDIDPKAGGPEVQKKLDEIHTPLVAPPKAPAGPIGPSPYDASGGPVYRC